MLYIVRIHEDGDIYDYEYSNLNHAREHLSSEKEGSILEYENGVYYLVECK